MATIRQIGPGRKTTGTIDGIIYVTRNGKTYARATPIMPAKVFNTPTALKRQAIFKMVQRHMKYHLRTLKQTITPKGNGTVLNRYYSENGKHFTRALDALAERWVADEMVTLADIEAAIAAYATENAEAIKIAMKDGYGEVFLTGEWPSTITLHANGGDSTVIIIVAENGATTTINPDGTTVVVETGDPSTGSGTGNGSGSGSGSDPSTGSGTGSGSGSDPVTPTVAAPVISGITPFEESTSVTMSGPDGASIHYTLDGTVPTSASTAYTEAITLTDTTTVKAIAVKDGVASSVTTRTFTQGTGGGDPFAG